MGRVGVLKKREVIRTLLGWTIDMSNAKNGFIRVEHECIRAPER